MSTITEDMLRAGQEALFEVCPEYTIEEREDLARDVWEAMCAALDQPAPERPAMGAWRLDIDECAIYCDDKLIATLATGDNNDDWRAALQHGQAIVDVMSRAASERERAAAICDDEARLRIEAAMTHPEGSAARDRCYAGARAATNCARGVRSGEVVGVRKETP